jgi:hypothetical protein
VVNAPLMIPGRTADPGTDVQRMEVADHTGQAIYRFTFTAEEL